MIAGFPDDHLSGFQELIDELLLVTRSSIRIISLALPDYDTKPIESRKNMGYTFPEVVELIDRCITHYVPDRTQKVNLIIHDWGAVYGYLYENTYPDRVNRLVGLDVGLWYSPKGKEKFISMLYQLWFASAYVVSQKVS